MSHSVVFATSNKFKFNHAAHMLEPFGITLTREHLDLEEIQADGEGICRHKAEQAYAQLKRPVVVNDDSWSIPGLKGFPGAYMKYMNDWLSVEDWLRLTEQLKDRREFLHQHIIYQDEHGQQHFMKEIEAQLLHEGRGQHYYGHLAITSFDSGQHSVAELVSSGQPAIDQSVPTAWQLFADWLSTQPEN